jgi:hypothetical protein
LSTTLLAALLVQCVAVALLRHRLGRRWLRRPVTVLVLASVVELGIGPGLLTVPSIGINDTFRLGVQVSFIDSADLIMAIAMLALTCTYLLTHPEHAVTRRRPDDTAIVTRALDWRLLAVACVPLTVLTAAGRGYNDGTADGQGTSLATSLVTTFFIVVVLAAAAAFLMRHGIRWVLPVLIIQSAVLAVAGERTPVLMDAIALILMLLFVGVRVPVPQLTAAIGVTALVMLAISGVRVQQGRGLFYTDSGLSTRVGALATGLSAVGESQGTSDTPGLLTQFAVRVSSADYAGAILQAISEGQPRLPSVDVPESLLLAVPSFLWPAKLDQETTLDPAQTQIDAFGLQNVNFIPGMPGLYIGYLAPLWLVVLFGMLGIAFGWFERWLLRECTPARLVLLGGAVITALWFEAGLPTMLVQMRSTGVLALTVHVAGVLRNRPRSARSSTALAVPVNLPQVSGVRGLRGLGR